MSYYNNSSDKARQNEINRLSGNGTKDQIESAVNFSETYKNASYKQQRKMKESSAYQNYLSVYKVNVLCLPVFRFLMHIKYQVSYSIY